MSTQLGARFERQAKQFLESLGCYVTRSAHSEGVADLVAIGPNRKPLMFVQCKLSGDLRITEWNELVAAAQRFGAMPVLASRSRDADGIDFYHLTDKRPQRSLDRLPMVLLAFEAADDLQTART